MILIWWTSQLDCDYIGEKLFGAPYYVKELYAERRGRTARGKIWNYSDSLAKIDPWPATQLGDIIKNGYGGIVVETKDVMELMLSVRNTHSFYGIITDTKLNVFDYEAMKKRIEDFESKFAW